MDTSEVYVKLCEKAEEIQNALRHRGFQLGDYICLFHKEVLIFFDIERLIEAENFYLESSNKIDRVWLPRQDQLQEIAWNNGRVSYISYQKPLSLLGWLFEFAFHTYQLERSEIQELINNKDASLEQLWLHFVMSKLYHKKWYNGEWRVENDRDTKNSQDASFRGEIHQSNMP